MFFNSDGELSQAEKKSLLKQIGDQWELDFGEQYKVNYLETNHGGFRGEGSTYIIVEYKEEKEPSNMLTWRKIETSEISDIKDELESLEVKKEEFPLFAECTIYKKNKNNDNLYVLYDNNNQLYVIESIK